VGAEKVMMSKLTPGYSEAVSSVSNSKRIFRLLTLTNGYNHYITSEAEYKEQHYEGGMTVYGPRSAEVFGEYLYQSRFTEERKLAESKDYKKETEKGLKILPGRRTVIYPRTQFIKRLSENKRKIAGIKKDEKCNRKDSAPFNSSKVEILWKDSAPGWLEPSDGPMIRVEKKNNKGHWEKVTWDNDIFMEVRTMGEILEGEKSIGAHLWKATWNFTGKEKWWKDRTFLHRVVIPKRNSYPEVVSESFQLCSS
jgi:hypothetical protein